MKPPKSAGTPRERASPEILEGEVGTDGVIHLTNGTLPPGTKVWAVPQRADAGGDLSDAWARRSLRTLSEWALENPY